MNYRIGFGVRRKRHKAAQKAFPTVPPMPPVMQHREEWQRVPRRLCMRATPFPPCCMICLEDLSQTPARGFLPCSHTQFCYSCICDWAKVTNTCPLCKAAFSLVMKWEGQRLTPAYELVESRAQKQDLPDDLQWPDALAYAACEVCLDSTHEEILMLCDECDRGFHTLCIGLVGVPDLVEWFCDRCLERKTPAQRKAQQRAINLVASVPDTQEDAGKRRRRLRKIRKDEDDDETGTESDVLVISYSNRLLQRVVLALQHTS